MYTWLECYFGLNLKAMTKPSEVSYTIMPNMGYLEFIPHDPTKPVELSQDTPPWLVELADVEVGKEYELVVTTYAGLCQYRVGDVLRVTGFHNAAPQFKFIRRKYVLLSIDADKTDELELQRMVENAAALLGEFKASVVEFTSYANTASIPGHYVICWELFTKDATHAPSDEVLAKCCFAMEESMNSIYRQCRVTDNSVGPLEIRIVRGGTFEELMEPHKKIDGRITVTHLTAAGSSGNSHSSDVALRKIYVSNIPFEISSERLLSHFAIFGKIEEMAINGFHGLSPRILRALLCLVYKEGKTFCLSSLLMKP